MTARSGRGDPGRSDKELRHVPIEIVEENAAALPQYERISIAFRVETRFSVSPIDRGLGGFEFVEETVEPYIKDYDAVEAERPTSWPERFDVSRWGFLSAFDGADRVGGAALAWGSPDVQMLEGREDLSCLWDIRVAPEYRGKGVGHLLFSHAAEWSRRKRCSLLKVETQNINVPACRFYAGHDCELRGISRYAYGSELDEIQLLWYLDL